MGAQYSNPGRIMANNTECGYTESESSDDENSSSSESEGEMVQKKKTPTKELECVPTVVLLTCRICRKSLKPTELHHTCDECGQPVCEDCDHSSKPNQSQGYKCYDWSCRENQDRLEIELPPGSVPSVRRMIPGQIMANNTECEMFGSSSYTESESSDDENSSSSESEGEMVQKKKTPTKELECVPTIPVVLLTCRICRKSLKPTELHHTCDECGQPVCEDCDHSSKPNQSQGWKCSFCRRRFSIELPPSVRRKAEKLAYGLKDGDTANSIKQQQSPVDAVSSRELCLSSGTTSDRR